MFQPPGGPVPGGSAPEGPQPGPGAAPGWDGHRAGAGFADGSVLDQLAPGPVLAWCTQQALDEGLRGLSDDELVGLLSAARRLSSWQAAVEFRAVGELDRRRRDAAGVVSSRTGDQLSGELAAALTLTSRSADELLTLSRELGRLPMVLAALACGVIDRAKALVFARELAGLSDVAAAAIGAVMWRCAGSMTTGQLGAELRALVLSLDPAAARRRAAKGRADARVEMWPESSGNAGLAGRELAAADVIVADQRITAVARALKDAGAEDSLDQLRASVFVALLTGRDLESLWPDARPTRVAGDPIQAVSGTTRAIGQPTQAAGEPTQAVSEPTGAGGEPILATSGLAALTGSVHLTIPLSAWLGRSDIPGEAAGYGPLDASACRDLASRLAASRDSRWSVTLTDADGQAVAHATARHGPGLCGQTVGVAAWLASLDFDGLARDGCEHRLQAKRYRPGARLANLIRVRQRTCAFPGCRRPARQCDLDHTVPFEQGGATCQCNLASLCRRHHQVKQAPGWQLTQAQPGVLTWTAPHGRTYTVGPGRYPADLAA